MLDPTPPLGGYSARFGTTTLREDKGLTLVSVAIPQGSAAALKAALNSAYGLDMPAPGASTEANGTRAIWTAPDQIFIAQDSGSEVQVQKALGNAAYTTDQTHAWCALALSGPLALDALERLCPLDLHPAAFHQDAAARTVMEHLGTIILRSGPQDYLLLSASSSARSFLHAIETSLRYVS